MELLFIFILWKDWNSLSNKWKNKIKKFLKKLIIIRKYSFSPSLKKLIITIFLNLKNVVKLEEEECFLWLLMGKLHKI
jgi:hypothetical protein